MKKLLLLLFSLLLSFNSYGEWTKTSEGEDGDSFYIDFQTVKKLNSGKVVAWLMVDSTEPTNGFLSDAKFYSSKMFWEVDCGLMRVKFLSMTQYEEPMGRGESENYDGITGIAGVEELMSWQYMPPDSLGYWNIEEVCSLAESYDDFDFKELVEQRIEHFESFDWEDDDVSTVLENTTIKETQAQWVRSIAEKVKSNWRYQGANDDWTAEVYILQDRNGNVLAVDVRNTNVGDSSRAKTFTDSIERAVRKSTPLPYTSNDDVFNKELIFIFSVN